MSANNTLPVINDPHCRAMDRICSLYSLYARSQRVVVAELANLIAAGDIPHPRSHSDWLNATVTAATAADVPDTPDTDPADICRQVSRAVNDALYDYAPNND